MMQLQRIRLEQVRKFRDALTLEDLKPGLNLIVGPNESGKSTLAHAIRSAFFERYRSVAAANLRPYADSSAAPTISIDFLIGNTQYHLSKRYLNRARCELSEGERRYEGGEAEERLAALLGYTYAKSGASQDRHHGIPGLLWIEQGQAHALEAVVSHAVDHLRQALGNGKPQATDEADNIIATIRDRRNALLTPSTNAPRGAYAEALREVQRLDAEVMQLTADADRYRNAVDRLNTLRQAHAESEAQRPWESLRRQEQQARQQLSEIEQLRAQYKNNLQEQSTLEAQARLIEEKRKSRLQQEQELHSREVACEKAHAALQIALAQETQLQQRHGQATEQVKQTQLVLAQLRQQKETLERKAKIQDLSRQLGQIEKQIQRTQALLSKQRQLQTELAENLLPDDVFENLQQGYLRQRELEIRRDAVATRLKFRLHPGIQATLDGQAIQDDGERFLTRETTLTLAQIGEFVIVPGGDDLAKLQQDYDALKQHLVSLQNKHAIENQHQALERHQRTQQLKTRLTMLQQELRLAAPDGLQALNDEREQLQQQLHLLCAHSTQDSEPTDTIAEVTSLENAELAHEEALAQQESIRHQWQQAQVNSSRAQAQWETAQQELARISAALQQAQLQQTRQEQDYAQTLAQINDTLSVLRQTAHHLQHRIQTANPELLSQDIERYQYSAQQQLQLHRDRAEQILRLEVELQTAGARGLDEALATGRQALEHAQRRAEELRRRAEALDFLLERLMTHRQQAMQALQAPLLARMLHYLRLLFPDATLDLTEQLAPSALHRPDVHGRQQAELLELLSHGAREQLGIIGRLAYADLLKDAGRPTFILLDDVLVHTDAARLDQMKRILFDAAKRHQILLLSCHPEHWLDLGVAPRTMDSLKASQIEIR